MRKSISPFFLFLFLWRAVPLAAQGSGGCVCTNCPQFMPDLFVGDFLLNVMGATNNNLASPAQGVCGVHLEFDHEFIGDLQITLVSPGGQSVTLVGSIGLFNSFTDFNNWDIDFVPCSVAPSPDGGFSDVFENNQDWGLFGNYTGSYWPNSGCLEDFDIGPVNGTWTLHIVDGLGDDVGNITGYEIIFCDGTGISCFTCAADAGDLLQADVAACEGSPSLDLSLPPTWEPPAQEPPAATYSYTYVVSKAGIILAYDPAADLTALPNGLYTVCGLSYLTAHAAQIPPPNGSLTVAQLSAALAGGQPPFCGDLSQNCVNVTINDVPPPETVFDTICFNTCYGFHGHQFCSTLDTTFTALTLQGCPFLATLHLVERAEKRDTIHEAACMGFCSKTPGFDTVCIAGTYVGIFPDTLSGCDSTVVLMFEIDSVTASIASPGVIGCPGPTIVLSGAGSTGGAGVSYSWTGPGILGPADDSTCTINQPGGYQLVLTKALLGTACRDTADVAVTASAPPPAPVIAGADSVCVGTTEVYSVQNEPGLTFNWTISAGGSITAGLGTNQISVLWTGPVGLDSVCLFTKNSCGNSPKTCLQTTLGKLPAAPVLPTIQPICEGDTLTLNIPAVPAATGYDWTLPPGSTLLSGQGTTSATVLFSTPPGGMACVAATNFCGASQPDCAAATVGAMPSPSAGADAANCGQAVSLTGTQTVPNSALNWSLVSGPGLAAFSDPTAAATQVTVNQYGSYVFRLLESNGACSADDSVSMVFHEKPAAGLLARNCLPGNLFYTVSFPISGGAGPWTVAGGTVIGNLFTSNQIASGAVFSFVITDANGCQSLPITGSFDCTCTTFSGLMSQTPLETCEGLTVAATAPLDAVLDATDAAAFFLHDNPGPSLGTVFDQNLTGTFSKMPAMNFGQTYYISYVVGNDLAGLPDLLDNCLSVAQGTPAIWWENPLANAGPNRDTCGLSTNLAAVPSVGFGSWSVASGPVGGVLLIDDPASPLTGATASKSGFYNLSWEESNHGCIASDVAVLTFFDKPTASQPVMPCDATGDNYTVSFSIGGEAPFTVDGAPLVGVNFNSPAVPSGTGFDFEITDANGCSTTVSGSKTCPCVSAAGQMPTAILTACMGSTVQAGPPIGASPDGNDAAAFVLHDLNSTTLGTIISINQTGQFGFDPAKMTAGQTYFISHVVGNAVGGLPNLTGDQCLSVSAGQPVVFYAVPTADAGLDQSTCGTTSSFSANQPAVGATGLWSIVSKPAGAVVNFSNTGSASGSATVSDSGIFLFEWKISQNGCSGADTVAVVFNQPPSISNLKKTCDATGATFALSFDIVGGKPPFAIAGLAGAFNGAGFLSDPQPSPSSFSLTITDAAGCTAALLGSHDCACKTDAGQMAGSKLSVCEADSAFASFLGGEFLDGDDTLLFVLHDGTVAAFGNPLLVNSEPKFFFQPPLVFGKTYFVSAVATSVVGGLPDLGDPCRSVSLGQPIVFRPTPSATLSLSTDSICDGQSAALVFSCTGDGPFTVNWTDGTNSFTQAVGLVGSFLKNISPSLSTTYSLISVNYGTNPVCSATLFDSVRIEVGQPTSAFVAPSATVCDNPIFGSTLDFSTLVTGGDLTGNWTEVGSSGAAGSLPVLDFDGVAAGLYFFKYTTAAAAAPCPQKVYQVGVTVEHCVCPSVETKAPPPLCNSGGQLNLKTLQVTAEPGVWTISSEPSGTNPATIAGNFFNANGSDSGVYEIRFSLVPAPPPGCPDSSVQKLTVGRAADAGSTAAPATFCEGDEQYVLLFPYIGGNPQLGGDWSEFPSNPPAPGFSPGLGMLATKHLLSGFYKFKYTVDGEPPCPSDDVVVTVFIQQSPTADAGPDGTLDCSGGSLKLGGVATSVGPDISYSWKKDGLSVIAAADRFLNVDQPGEYEILVVRGALGCLARDTAQVVEANRPTALSTQIGEIPCTGQSVGSISAGPVAGGTEPYLFSLNGGLLSSQSFWGGLTAGFYEIRTQDALGCERLDTIELAAANALSVDLGPDVVVELGDSLAVFAQILPPQAAVDTLIWSPLLNPAEAGMPVQTIRPLHTWLLSITALDEHGCRATDQKLVEVKAERKLYAPTVFKPGAKDANSMFTVFGGADITKVRTLRVFDRWGELLFENRDFQPNQPSLGWDGTRGGREMQPGVFVWWADVLFTDGETKTYKGDVLLAR